MKNKKGFTLIELLAVIIILGILMIIAIPSVTTYISNSRRSSYIVTAKNIISAARTKVNEGKLGTYNPNVTYYLPYSCMPFENGVSSPYGDFVQAYAIVVYNADGFSYYWASTDSTETGIEITPEYALNEDKIVNGLKEIPTNIGVGSRPEIVLFSEDCKSFRTYPAGSNLSPYEFMSNVYTDYFDEHKNDVCVDYQGNYCDNDIFLSEVVASGELGSNIERREADTDTLNNLAEALIGLNYDETFKAYSSGKDNYVLTSGTRDIIRYKFDGTGKLRISEAWPGMYRFLDDMGYLHSDIVTSHNGYTPHPIFFSDNSFTRQVEYHIKVRVSLDSDGKTIKSSYVELIGNGFTTLSASAGE